MFENHSPDEEFIARLGREFPYSTVGQWVYLADIPHQSKTLYALLRLHVNGARGDNKVWPTQATLAALMGLKKPEAVARWTKPLVELGAVEVEEVRWGPRRMYRRLLYTVHEAPPASYTSVRSIQEYYRARSAANPQVAPVTPLKGASARHTKPQVALMTPLEGAPVTPPEGAPVIPLKGGRIPPREGDQLPKSQQQPELKELEERGRLPRRFRSSPSADAPGSGPGRLALENAASTPEGDRPPTRVGEVTHHPRARVRAHTHARELRTRELRPVIRIPAPTSVEDLITGVHGGEDPSETSNDYLWHAQAGVLPL